MKRIILFATALILSTGCANMRTVERELSADGTLLKVKTSSATVILQKSALEGFSLLKTTKTGGSAVSISKAENSTDHESIDSLANLLGAVAEKAATGAVKGVKP